MSQHFSTVEFACHSGEAYPSAWITTRLAPLCDVLEVLRDALGGKPVVILSGYRTPAYNAAVGGASRSEHMEGRAADIAVAGASPSVVHATLLSLHEAGAVRIGGLGLYSRWVHVDVRPGPLARWHG